jgi:hypothetical protein
MPAIGSIPDSDEKSEGGKTAMTVEWVVDEIHAAALVHEAQCCRNVLLS